MHRPAVPISDHSSSGTEVQSRVNEAPTRSCATAVKDLVLERSKKRMKQQCSVTVRVCRKEITIAQWELS